MLCSFRCNMKTYVIGDGNQLTFRAQHIPRRCYPLVPSLTGFDRVKISLRQIPISKWLRAQISSLEILKLSQILRLVSYSCSNWLISNLDHVCIVHQGNWPPTPFHKNRIWDFFPKTGFRISLYAGYNGPMLCDEWTRFFLHSVTVVHILTALTCERIPTSVIFRDNNTSLAWLLSWNVDLLLLTPNVQQETSEKGYFQMC